MSMSIKATLCFLTLTLLLVSTGCCAKGQPSPEAETQETAAATEEVSKVEPVEAETAPAEGASEPPASTEAEGETTETEEPAAAATPEP